MLLRRTKFLISVMMLLIMVTFVSADQAEAEYLNEFGSRVLRPGHEGLDVAVLQQKLNQMEYYNGKIDGIYGSGTVQAVKKFQAENELKIDGIFGNSSFEALPELNILDQFNISRDEVLLLARVIHGEARGEDFKGKVAVASVILNRIKSPHFPDTIRDVIVQKGQFSSLMDGQANYYPGKSELAAARAALLGYDPTKGSIYFYNPEVATNTAWISGRNYVTRIGEHVFLR